MRWAQPRLPRLLKKHGDRITQIVTPISTCASEPGSAGPGVGSTKAITKRSDRNALRVTSRMERKCLQGLVGSSPRLNCYCTIGMRGWRESSHPCWPLPFGVFFSTLPAGLYEAQGYSHLRITTLIAEDGRKLRAATRDDRWKKWQKKFIIHTDIHLHAQCG